MKRGFRREDLSVYELVDWSGEEVKGTFYESDLQAVNVDPNKEYYVEKVLKRRKRKGKTELFVRWLHRPKKYDSWIVQKDLTQFS